MIKFRAVAGLLGAAMFAVPAVSYAGDFPAAPLNSGPPNLPGQAILPGADLAIGLANDVTRPLVQPILVPDAGVATPAAGPPVVKHHRARRHYVARKVKKTA